MSSPTLGSLFDGSGGFTLAATICGIKPLWASEVEPFPIRVTTKRIPSVKHLGDINKIDGTTVPPVDIITGGFCCQDLSVAGKRAGLHGERSGLFFQIIRIIKEMRNATNNKYPKYAVLENVPGMYSSRNGRDYLEVLNELIKIKDETLSVPMPEKSKWHTAGEIVGDDFSLAWRTLDAQFWGVAQRRRRCYIVVDFTGECAGKVLFDESRLYRNTTESRFSREATTRNAESGIESSVTILNDQGGSFIDLSQNITGTLRSQVHGHQPIIFEPGAASRIGGHAWQNKVPGALRADMGDNRLAVVIENHPVDSRIKINEDGIVQTLTERMGSGGCNVPLVMNERQYELTVGENVANTLTATDYKGAQCLFEPYVASFMGGQSADARSIAYNEDVTPTIKSGAGGNSVPMVMTAFGISAHESNAMKSDNPHSGIYKAETSRTLDSGGGRPDCHQGGIAVVFDGKQITSKDNRSNPQPGDPCHTLGADNSVVCIQGNMIGRDDESGPNGSGINENISFTLTGQDRHGVAYGIDRAAFNQGKNALYVPQIDVEQSATVVARGPNAVAYPTYAITTGCFTQVCEEKSPTLQARDYKDAPAVSRPQYIVRRLTPTECALLQGFASSWCDGLDTPAPTEEDINFWAQVWETHRLITGTSKKPKSRNQIIKWLKNPHSDSAEYKMWGNGVALPCVVFVLGGIANILMDE